MLAIQGWIWHLICLLGHHRMLRETAMTFAKSFQSCPTLGDPIDGPWGSPGENTGMGRHFLLPCMKVKSESEVTQSCRTLSDPMDCSLPGSSSHGIFQARVLELGAIDFWSHWKCIEADRNIVSPFFCNYYTGPLAKVKCFTILECI